MENGDQINATRYSLPHSKLLGMILMLTKKIIAPALFTCMIFLVFTSCVYEKEELLYPPGNCDTANPTYSLMVQPIISANCYSCHSTANSAVSGGGIQLDSYAKIKVFVDNGKLVGSISHSAGFSPMPKNSAKLKDCDINKIKAWVAAGAPNN